MAKIVVSLIAFAMIVAFLGNYALSINSVPLWVIILGVLAMVIADVWQDIYSDHSSDRSGATDDQG